MDTRSHHGSEVRSRAKSCFQCRQKKLRCNRKQPCSNCQRSRRDVCSYGPGEAARPAHTPGETARSAPDIQLRRESTNPASAAESPASTRVILSPAGQQEGWHVLTVGSILVPSRIGDPELIGSEALWEQQGQATEQSTSRACQSPPTSALDNLAEPIRGAMVDNTYHSSSNWIISLTLIPQALSWYDKQSREKSECWHVLQTCKAICTQLRSKSILPWNYGQYGTSVPSRHIADALVDGYFRTFEKIYRILHVPTFNRDYNLYWESPNSAKSSFIVQMQLCMALGAMVYDDDFSLRCQVLQWIREATFLLELGDEPSMTISTIQTRCLLSLVRSMESIHLDKISVYSGDLIRPAMNIGLHRDPARLPGIPKAEVEIRRRLWATVMELSLGFCLESGAPPSISISDFDCDLPSNINDDSIGLEANCSATSCDSDQLTDTSVQIALGRSFATRLSLVKYSNGMGTRPCYEESLRRSSEFASVCLTLSKTLESLQPRISNFQKLYCETIMRQHLFALHLCYVPAALHNPAFVLSRNLCVEASLKMCHAVMPLSSAQGASLRAVREMMGLDEQCQDYTRLALCASGTVRAVIFQAVMVIAAELSASMDESCNTFQWSIPCSAGFFPINSSIRNMELLSFLRLAVEWINRRLRNAQENFKGYIFVSAVLAGVQARLTRTPMEEQMDHDGLNACTEAKSLLTEMLGDDAQLLEGVAADETTTTADDEYWASYLAGMNIETLMSIT